MSLFLVLPLELIIAIVIEEVITKEFSINSREELDLIFSWLLVKLEC